MKKIVVCGDSFSIGIGCHNLENEPFGSLLAKHFNCELINLAKGSSTNLSIYLQVKYAVEKIRDIEFLCLGVTSSNRTEWFSEGSTNKNFQLTNTDVNYHEYPPYGNNTYQHLLPYHPMENDPKYIGDILTENYHGVVTYVEMLDRKIETNDYFKKFHSEPDDKMRLLKDYFLNFYDERLQRIYDMGVITMSHILLKSKNVKHYILTHDEELKQYIPESRLVYVNWGDLSVKFPDDLKSLHTSWEGQREVYHIIIDKINNNLV